MEFGNYPLGRHTFVEIIRNEGLFNDIEQALQHYHSIFGISSFR